MVMALDEFSTLQSTMNAHRQHSNATMIESMLRPVVVFVSCAFAVVVVELLMQIHCPIFPMNYITTQLESNGKGA